MIKFYNSLFIIPLLFGFCFHGFSQQKVNDEIIIDGLMSENEWNGAKIFNLKYEVEPGDNTDAPFKTTAFVLYSDTKLYVAFEAKISDITLLRASIRERDTAWGDDWVSIALDTYNDNRNLIIVGANAYGSQIDFKLVSGEDNGDPGFDINYDSNGTITKDGYIVEMAIPFSEFQYKKKDVLNWKIGFYREAWLKSKIGISSSKFDKADNCLSCQFDTYIELKGINPKKRLEFLPFISGNYTGNSEGDKLKYGKPAFKAGISTRYDISSSTSLDMTINPDFSQIESDVTKIDVNSQFAINYREKRPFFNEGNDILSTLGDLVYSRSINNPIFASKLVNQGEKNRIYFLTSYDMDTPYLVPGEDRSYMGKGEESFGNILRYQRVYENGSNIGFLSTNRFYKGGGMGNLFAGDANFRLNKKYQISFDFAHSMTEEPNNDWLSTDDVVSGKSISLNGEKFSGNKIGFGFNRNTKNWRSELQYSQYSPLFRTDMGFITNNNYKQISFDQVYIKERNEKVIRYFAQIESKIKYSYSGKLKQTQLFPMYSMRLNNGFQFTYGYAFIPSEEYKGIEFDNYGLNFLNIRYSPTEKFNMFSRLLIGSDIAYNIDKPVIGNRVSMILSLNYQPSDKFNTQLMLSSESMKYKGTSDEIYSGYIFRTDLNYQFNKDFSLKLVSEYNDFSNSLFIQSLLKWNPNPSTIFYLGGNTDMDYVTDLNDNWSTDSAQLFFKLQYLFKIQ
jgi:hypothetical protein